MLLWAELRTADHGAAHGVVAALTRVVAAVRRRCPRARIVVRGDSAFGVEEIMAWCEAQPNVYYCLGLSKNSVLIRHLTPALTRARERSCLCGAPSVREFAEFEYRTVTSWSRARRVVGKAEVLTAGDNPRFIVTNLLAVGGPDEADPARFSPARLYEELYCARGEMENVLKQQTLDLTADKLSTHYRGSNQLRLWLAAFADLLLERLRTLGCHGTTLARATVGTVRCKLLLVAAHVTVSVRRVHVRLSSAYARADLFRLCHLRLRALAPPAT